MCQQKCVGQNAVWKTDGRCLKRKGAFIGLSQAHHGAHLFWCNLRLHGMQSSRCYWTLDCHHKRVQQSHRAASSSCHFLLGFWNNLRVGSKDDRQLHLRVTRGEPETHPTKLILDRIKKEITCPAQCWGLLWHNLNLALWLSFWNSLFKDLEGR